MRKILAVTAFFVLLGIFAATGYAAPDLAQQPSARFYKNKTFVFLVPWGAGGGYDFWPRVMAPYIKKFSGVSRVIVLNKPGAGGMVGYNWLYNSAKPNGLTISIGMPSSMVLHELVNEPGKKYDKNKFTWLGRLSENETVMVVRKNFPYKSWHDLDKIQKIKIGGTDTDSENHVGTIAFLLASGLPKEKVQLVYGYQGISQLKPAVMRGEIDGLVRSLGSVLDLIEAGEFIPIARVGKQRSKLKPDLPTIYELNPKMPPETKKWVDFMTNWVEFGRAVFAPPGVPQQHAQYLTALIKKVVDDPKVVDMVQAGGYVNSYVDPATYSKILTEKLTTHDREKFLELLYKHYLGKYK